MGMRIAGAAGASVTSCSRMASVSMSMSSSVKRPGSTICAPTAVAAKGRPQHCTWNMGVSIMTLSAPVRPLFELTAMACSHTERWDRKTPLGRPVVPVV